MSSLKRRLNEDEAAISSLQAQVNNLKKFKIGDRTITMREVPRSGPGFPFQAPPQSAPRVNVNVQAPRSTYADVKEGERQAYLSNYKMSYPRISNPSIAVAPSGGYRRSSYAKKMQAKRASKASLARARTSAKRGGTKIPKKTLLKAVKKTDRSIAYNMWMKQTKARLLQALKSRKKNVLAKCLSYS